jgi:hypothetical protein
VIRLLWRLSRGYRLRPWRSPYLRWRIETYSGLHAESIGFREFWRVVWGSRREFARYLRWAARMAEGQSRGSAFIRGKKYEPRVDTNSRG